MKIIDNNKINLALLKESIKKQELFTKSTDKFWDDEYISEQMLKAHLNPGIESASKTKETIEAETDFIIKLTEMRQGKSVLDLGCGPGLYVREFAKTGAMVTGVDISDRSLKYANENIRSQYNNTHFIKKNYLNMDFNKSFDIATMIFYDFGALNTKEQNLALSNIYKALNDNGYFIFDVISEAKTPSPSTSISVHEHGFWSPTPYVEILNTYLYDDPKTEAWQYTIIDQDGITKVMRLYNSLFNLKELTEMLNKNGFKIEKTYKNLKGELLTKDSETFGIVARKL